MNKKYPVLRLTMTSLWCASLAGALLPSQALPQVPYYEGKTIKEAIAGQAPGRLGSNKITTVVYPLQKIYPGKAPHRD